MTYNIPPGMPTLMSLQPVLLTLLTLLNPSRTGTSSRPWDTPSSWLPRALCTCCLLRLTSCRSGICGPENWLPPLHPGSTTSPEGASRTLTSPGPQKPHPSVTPLPSIQSTRQELSCLVCSFICMLTVGRPLPPTLPVEEGRVLLRLLRLHDLSICRIYHTAGVQ